MSDREPTYIMPLGEKGQKLSKYSCTVQDCDAPIRKFMVSEMAPGRAIVYGVCERDAALIMLHERPVA